VRTSVAEDAMMGEGRKRVGDSQDS